MRWNSLKARWNWWWGFGLLIAAPALVLALLGLRAVRAERIERQQRVLEQQKQSRQLVDAAIDSALTGLETDLGRMLANGWQEPPPESPAIQGLVFFFDRSASLLFPREKVYFGERPARITTEWTPPIEDLVETARQAEAQSRFADAMLAYSRVGEREPKLRAWSDLSILRTRHQTGDADAVERITNPEWGRSEGLTPTGLPVAFMACTYMDRLPSQEQGRGIPVLEQTLNSLRSGRWWLSYDERRFYEREISRLLESAGHELVKPGGNIEELAAVEQIIRQSQPPPSEAPARSYQRNQYGGFLIIWLPRSERQQSSGLALSEGDLSLFLNGIVAPVLSHQLFGATLRDHDGRKLWGNANNVGHSEPLRSVRGWELGFETFKPAGLIDQRQLLWYGFILLLIVMLTSGLAMSARIVRRELELGRIQNEFIAAVTHEFKSPLTSIRLLMERISQGRQLTREASSQYHTAITHETERLERLVNRLLDAQQIQMGSKQYSFAPASIVAFTENAVKDLRPHADARNISLRIKAEKDLPVLNLDEAAMTDALENLIDNAIKYSPPGTEIEIDVRSRDSEVSVDVFDQGIGIEADEVERIFEKFYRGRRGNAQNVRGTGLGLALVKATVEAHAGSIAVSSSPGHGSRFSVRLPVPRGDENNGPHPNRR